MSTSAIQQRLHPTVVLHNRLEGTPRSEDFDRSLQAEVRDALWMLTRQWQFGEFRAEDAGSPAFAMVNVATARLTKYMASNGAQTQITDEMPLQAIVERRPIPETHGGTEVSLDVRLLMGRQWLKLVARLGNFAPTFVAMYPVQSATPASPEEAPIAAHPESGSTFAAVQGHCMDGMKLYKHLSKSPPGHAYDGIPALSGRQNEVRQLEQRFMAWFQRLFRQPMTGEDAWQKSRLEYQFSVSSPSAVGDKVLTAEEYYDSHLDWYSFDADRVSPRPNTPSDLNTRLSDTQTLVPTPLSFEGMPNSRWWSFEDRRTNFGDVKPNVTELGKLLLLEFALVYSNDWWIIPYNLSQGAVAQIRGMAVTNVFGERLWIEAAGTRSNESWQKWGMFLLAPKGGGAQSPDQTLILLPTAVQVQQGPPLEKVFFVRDEVANIAWAIEDTICLPNGETKPGLEAGRETRAFFQKQLEQSTNRNASSPEIAQEPSLRYTIMNSVPENWIPFIPVHVPNSSRAMQLQRAALPRILTGDTKKPQRVRPRTSMLSAGLDLRPRAPFYIFEEEVPRAGVCVTMRYNRARWRDGTVCVWLGMRKEIGRGERSSGLAFDQIVPVRQQS